MTTERGLPPLPEGWRWDKDGRTLKREVGGHAGWWIEVEFDSHAPWDGPTGLQIKTDFSTDEGLSAVADTSGLTTGLLRSVPLGDIRREYKDIRRALRTLFGTLTAERVESDRDLALVARHYAELVAEGHRSPIVELSEIWAVGRKTMSARVQRARARGLLEGEKHKPANRLTDKARQLIAEQPREGE